MVSEELTQELREITGKLQAACAASPDGYVTRAALEAAGLSRATPTGGRGRWNGCARSITA